MGVCARMLEAKPTANGAMMRHIDRVCAETGFDCPPLLTTLQPLGDDHVD